VAVKIRLRRVGAKKQPSYRIVVADSHAPRDGRFIEIIGFYNPLTKPHTVVINRERALYWLRHGAQATDAVQHMLEVQYIWAEYKGEEVPIPEPVVEPEPVVVAPEVEETPAEAPVAEEAAVEAPAAEEAPAEEPVVESAVDDE